MKILIVGDSETSVKLFRKVLSYDGYEPIHARDWEEGAGIAKKDQPALILVDLHMGKTNGAKAMDILSSDASRGIPVIAALSHPARCFDASQRRLFDNCATIEHPIDTREFLRVVSETIKNQSLP